MARSELWKINIAVETDGTTTCARVRVRGAQDRAYLGVGLVRTDLQRIHSSVLASELAVARALSDLTEELLSAVCADVEAQVHTQRHEGSCA